LPHHSLQLHIHPSPLYLLHSLLASRATRALHSFPTRRSSDLRKNTFSTSPRRATSATKRRMWPRAVACSRTAIIAWRGLPSDDRSEEHTSELQSPDHLVCRLLLEKKKKNTRRSSSEKREHKYN